MSDVQTMDDAIAASVPRFNVELLGVFALVALYLSAVGVYGVTSTVVSWRTHEIGVRMALGAQASGVLRMIVRETRAVGTTSVGIGVLLALLVTRAMAGLRHSGAAEGHRHVRPGTDYLLAVLTSNRGEHVVVAPVVAGVILYFR